MHNINVALTFPVCTVQEMWTVMHVAVHVYVDLEYTHQMHNINVALIFPVCTVQEMWTVMHVAVHVYVDLEYTVDIYGDNNYYSYMCKPASS